MGAVVKRYPRTAGDFASPLGPTPVTSKIVCFLPVTESGSVPAIIPLSLFEAMRNLDTPVEDGLDEIADEIVIKRLGLSTTVATQIERYRAASRRDEPIDGAEVVAVFRLVNRRADAGLVYADAGRRTARYAAREISGVRRGLMQISPPGLRRRLGISAACWAAEHVLQATLHPHGEDGARVELRESLAVHAEATGTGCLFYSAAFAELLRVLSGFEGAMVHEGCLGRGDASCRWSSAAAEGYE